MVNITRTETKVQKNFESATFFHFFVMKKISQLIFSPLLSKSQKKRVTAVTQTFVNLKSNTMKNTMQR